MELGNGQAYIKSSMARHVTCQLNKGSKLLKSSYVVLKGHAGKRGAPVFRKGACNPIP